MEHRKALRRNMAQSLFEHGQIITTLEKAKDLRPFAERLITLAKQARQGNLGARRRIHRLMGERFLIPKDNQGEYDDMSDAQRRSVRQSRSGRHHRTGEARGNLPFTTEAVSHRLITAVAERFEDRSGGYTRIIKLSRRRIGDNGCRAIIQLLGEEAVPTNVPKARGSARKTRAKARYSAVKRLVKKGGAATKPAAPTTDDGAPPASDE